MTRRLVVSMRVAAFLLGLLMCSLAVLADRAGLSATAGPGEGQILAGVFGVLLLLAALLGSGFPRFWMLSGRILLAGSVLFILVGAFRAFMTSLAGDPRGDMEWLLDKGLVPGVEEDLLFRPHLLWIGAGEGDAWTPGSAQGSGAGSVIWIYGSAQDLPDCSREIEALLKSASRDSAIVDRRQPCYNSTQSLILFLQDLHSHEPPDSVILIAGPADVAAALENGDPSWPMGSRSFLARTRSIDDLSMGISGMELALALRRVQEVNRTILCAVAREYGAGASFIWVRGSRRSEPDRSSVARWWVP